jgi:hypothetical protein
MVIFSNAKDPDDTDDFTLDWVNNLASGETISTFVATATGITVSSSVFSGSLTTVRLTGGTEATRYDVRYRITTSTGRQLDETARILVETR